MSVRPKAESATYIFDEVDAGVGGLTLNKLAEKLENLAKQRQMLVITHWPQLAARHRSTSRSARPSGTMPPSRPVSRLMPASVTRNWCAWQGRPARRGSGSQSRRAQLSADDVLSAYFLKYSFNF